MARTDNFRKQHKEILEIVGKIVPQLKPEILSKDASTARTLLSKLVGKLSLHLSMEDKSLYPELINNPDKKSSELASRFQKEMKQVKEVIITYDQRWPSATAIQKKAPDFISETKGIFDALGKRITLEESELYNLADKLE
jgi:hypothetical protein